MKNKLMFPVIYAGMLVLTSIGCNSTQDTVQTEVKEEALVDTTTSTPSLMPEKTVISETGTNCKHAVSQSLVKKGSYPNATFQLQTDKNSGVDNIKFDNGDILTIRNWGCNYAALTFYFETSRFQDEPTNAGFWYKRTVTLLNEVHKNLETNVDVAKGTERLVTQIENNISDGYQNLKFDEELPFGEDAMRNFVIIQKVEKLSDKKYGIEVTFAKGPLL